MNLVIMDEKDVKRLLNLVVYKAHEVSCLEHKYDLLVDKHDKLKANYDKEVISVNERNAALEEELHHTNIALRETRDLLATFSDLIEREIRYNQDVRH